MKKFIITEEEKNRIRGLYEQSQPVNNPVSNNGKIAFDTIKKAMSGIGTDEDSVLKGVLMIKNQSDYNTALSLVKKEPIMLNNPKSPQTIMSYISSDMSYYKPNVLSQTSITGDIEGSLRKKDNQMLMKMSQHLINFNQQETVVDKPEQMGASTR